MAEYIDKEALAMQVLGLTIVNPMVAQYADAVLLQIQQAPAADVVEVVRCRDCQYGRVVRCGDTEFIDCAFENDEYLHERLPTDFCSYGEKR